MAVADKLINQELQARRMNAPFYTRSYREFVADAMEEVVRCTQQWPRSLTEAREQVRSLGNVRDLFVEIETDCGDEQLDEVSAATLHAVPFVCYEHAQRSF